MILFYLKFKEHFMELLLCFTNFVAINLSGILSPEIGFASNFLIANKLFKIMGVVELEWVFCGNDQIRCSKNF